MNNYMLHETMDGINTMLVKEVHPYWVDWRVDKQMYITVLDSIGNKA